MKIKMVLIRRNTEGICCMLMTLMIILMAVCFRTVSSLQCFTCEAEDTNENCNIKEAPVLKTCTSRQDRCLTQVIYSTERGKLRIDKECTTEDGCTAATTQLGKRYFCDKSRPAWGCVECCDTDRCNENGVADTRASAAVVLGALSSVVLALHVL
ncbi:UPAR/Ly6 domain-containing protein cold-like [Asterias amurensis]|uniref:UPAR/Ly6 domain-containing protein cold-like n=1 Tax=Asterias amurensis TaxID=7602 RepID=UPI003AB3ECBB